MICADRVLVLLANFFTKGRWRRWDLIADCVERREYDRQIKQIVRTIIDFSESDRLIKT